MNSEQVASNSTDIQVLKEQIRGIKGQMKISIGLNISILIALIGNFLK